MYEVKFKIVGVTEQVIKRFRGKKAARDYYEMAKSVCKETQGKKFYVLLNRIEKIGKYEEYHSVDEWYQLDGKTSI